MTGLTDPRQKWLQSFFKDSTDAKLLSGLLAAPGASDRSACGPALPGYGKTEAFTTDAPEPGEGGSFRDNSYISYTCGYVFFWVGPDEHATVLPLYQGFDKRITLNFHGPGAGRLTLLVKIEGFQDNVGPGPFNDSFTQDTSVIWQVKVDADGKLTLVREAPEVDPPHGGTKYTLQALNPSESESGKFVSVNPEVVGTSHSTTSDHSTTIGAGIASHTEGGGTSDSTVPRQGSTKITIDLNPIVPPKPEPHGIVTVEPIVSAAIKLTAEIGPFQIGKAVFEGDLVAAVRKQLWNVLSDEDKHALAQGDIPGESWPDGTKTGIKGKIEVHGYTSNTDTIAHNSKLAHERALAVIGVLTNFGIPDSSFAPPISEDESASIDADTGYAPTDDPKKEKESAAWRKVVVIMNVVRTTMV